MKAHFVVLSFVAAFAGVAFGAPTAGIDVAHKRALDIVGKEPTADISTGPNPEVEEHSEEARWCRQVGCLKRDA
ncbi:hypothetical protein K474DRAFT_1667156 [Panus rudis PR-1116 ss-1]|nr:hypothetical protein K474DRAFT_1667156 [Panus rudis PR-1116 ss-1]